MEQRTYKILGGRGGYLQKKFLNGFARTGKTAQNKIIKGQLSSLAPPPPLAEPLLSTYLLVTKLIDFSIRIDA